MYCRSVQCSAMQSSVIGRGVQSCEKRNLFFSFLKKKEEKNVPFHILGCGNPGSRVVSGDVV